MSCVWWTRHGYSICSCTSSRKRRAQLTARGAEQVHDGAHLRFVNELVFRLTRVVEQLLAEDATRPADDVVLRMLLTPRADKVAERLVFNAYGRAIQGFESYDTTVLMGG